MINGMKEFMTGVRSMAIGWQVWVMIMMIVNGAIPLFFWEHPEARWTLATFMASGMIGALLVQAQGFSRLLGLMHVLWVPLLVYLAGAWQSTASTDLFGLWIRIVCSINAISLVIDASDVVRYLKGERAPVIPKPGLTGG